MANVPHTKLKSALTKLLESEITLPPVTEEGAPFSFQENFENSPEVLRTLNAKGDIDTFRDPGEPTGITIGPKCSMREFLSALAYDTFGDVFILESTREEARIKYHSLYRGFCNHDKSVFVLHNRGNGEEPAVGYYSTLHRYSRFFRTMTFIVDHDELPPDYPVDDIPDILRDGLTLIKQAAEAKRTDMGYHLDRNTAENLEDDKAKVIANHMLYSDEPLPEWVTGDLREEIVNFRCLEYSRDKLKQAHVIEKELIPLVQHHTPMTAADYRVIADEAAGQEDAQHILENVANSLIGALTEAGIAPRVRGDISPNK